MFGKIKALFSLEARMADKLSSILTPMINSERELKERLAAYDHFAGDFRTRLSRLEVLLADELKEKEKARDELIRLKRLERG